MKKLSMIRTQVPLGHRLFWNSVIVMFAATAVILIHANLVGQVLMLKGTSSAQAAAQPASLVKQHFTLTSPGFGDGEVIPDKFTAPTPDQFQNSPPLAWSGAPQGTMSYVFLLHDLDAAINHRSDDVTHWLIYNIPAAATSLSEGISPLAQLSDGSVQALNQRKTLGYLGPGARGSYHHYVFELYALDTKLTLPKDASRADIFNAMQGHILDKAVLTAKYKRKDS